MTYEQLIKHYGSQIAAAKALELSQPAVSGWQLSGIPVDRQIQYEVATKGILKADLPRQIRKVVA